MIHMEKMHNQIDVQLNHIEEDNSKKEEIERHLEIEHNCEKIMVASDIVEKEDTFVAILKIVLEVVNKFDYLDDVADPLTVLASTEQVNTSKNVVYCLKDNIAISLFVIMTSIDYSKTMIRGLRLVLLVDWSQRTKSITCR